MPKKEADIMKRNLYLFVYGTLMRGQGNHAMYMWDSQFVAGGKVTGFDMYDVGHFPAAVPGKGTIKGELYLTNTSTIRMLNILEGEGTLYRSRKVNVFTETGEEVSAIFYEFVRNTAGMELIPEECQPYTADWKEAMPMTKKNDYVWYVSYGSNMLMDRFMCYIKGGSYKGSRGHAPCSNTARPKAVRNFEIPYDMYYGNTSYSWEGGGVSFLDISKPGKALGVAYLISREQFEHVAREENGGHEPAEATGWYNTVVKLGQMDGMDVLTITNDSCRLVNHPAKSYVMTLDAGLAENYPEMSKGDRMAYLL